MHSTFGLTHFGESATIIEPVAIEEPIMALSSASQEVMEQARRVYDERLREELEAEHFGEVIAVEPESGEYVLGKDFMAVSQACRQMFGNQMTYTFRVGGGGAVKFGGAFLNASLKRQRSFFRPASLALQA